MTKVTTSKGRVNMSTRVSLRNKLDFWNVYGLMNTSGLVQNK